MGYPHESKYKREDNWGEYGNCFNDYNGTKDSKRPKHFCDKVTMASTLSVAGATSLASTLTVGGVASFAANASVSGTLSCGRLCASVIDWGCQSDAGDGIYKYPGPGKFVGGSVEFEEGITSSGDVSVGNSGSRAGGASFSVAGASTLRGSTSIGSTLEVGGESTFDLGVNVSGGLNVVQDAYFDNDIYSRNRKVTGWQDYINEVSGEAVFQQLRTVSDMHCGDTLTAHIMKPTLLLIDGKRAQKRIITVVTDVQVSINFANETYSVNKTTEDFTVVELVEPGDLPKPPPFP